MSSPERPPDTIDARVRAVIEASLSQATTRTELRASLSSRLLDDAHRAHWLIWGEASELGAYAMAAAGENAVAGFDHIERIMGVRSAKQLFVVQEDYARAQSDRFGAQVAALNDLTAKAAKAYWASI